MMILFSNFTKGYKFPRDNLHRYHRITKLYDGLVNLKKWKSVLDLKIENLQGVGPKLSGAFLKLDITRVRHLLLHLPSNIVDRSQISTISQLRSENINKLVTLRVSVVGDSTYFIVFGTMSL